MKNRLHLSSPEMEFKGFAMGTGTSAVNEWEVGFVQNILECVRTGLYTNGVRRTMRQNPRHLPIRDGTEGECLWYDSENRCRKNLSLNLEISVETNDAPNFDLPIRYSGNLKKPFDEGSSILQSTEGRDVFRIFFVAAHDRTKSLIVLAACEWTINWGGTFNAAMNTWAPDQPITTTVRDISSYVCPNPLFLGLRDNSATPLPFNPNAACGFENFEIQTGPGEWAPCNGKGTVTDKNALGTMTWVARA